MQVEDSTANTNSAQDQEELSDSAKANNLFKQAEELQKKSDADKK